MGLRSTEIVGKVLFTGGTLMCSRCFTSLEPTQCVSVSARPERGSKVGRVSITTMCVSCRDAELKPKKKG